MCNNEVKPHNYTVEMLNSSHFIKRIREQLGIHAVTALLGPRQCWKTTLAKQIAENYSEPIHRYLQHMRL